MLVAIDPEDFGIDMTPPGLRNKTSETFNLSTWARLAMLAEAVEVLATDPGAQGAVKAAKATFPGWFRNATIGPGQGWRRWEASAKRFVAAAAESGQVASVRAALVKSATAATAALAPAAQAAPALAGKASAAIAAARKLLAWARKGRAVRKVGSRVGNPTRGRKAAGALAAGAAGAGAAAAGAGAVAAGASGGKEAARQVFGPGGLLDVGSWSTGAKLLGAAAVAAAAWKLTRPSKAAKAGA